MFVYQFKDKHNGIIYVGQTKRERIEKRMYEHRQGSNLHKEIFENEVEHIEFAKVQRHEIELFEMYLIAKHKPKYNTTFKNLEELQWEPRELEWEYYGEYEKSELENAREEIERLKKENEDIQRRLDDRNTRMGWKDNEIKELKEQVKRAKSVMSKNDPQYTKKVLNDRVNHIAELVRVIYGEFIISQRGEGGEHIDFLIEDLLKDLREPFQNHYYIQKARSGKWTSPKNPKKYSL